MYIYIYLSLSNSLCLSPDKGLDVVDAPDDRVGSIGEIQPRQSGRVVPTDHHWSGRDVVHSRRLTRDGRLVAADQRDKVLTTHTAYTQDVNTWRKVHIMAYDKMIN